MCNHCHKPLTINHLFGLAIDHWPLIFFHSCPSQRWPGLREVTASLPRRWCQLLGRDANLGSYESYGTLPAAPESYTQLFLDVGFISWYCGFFWRISKPSTVAMILYSRVHWIETGETTITITGLFGLPGRGAPGSSDSFNNRVDSLISWVTWRIQSCCQEKRSLNSANLYLKWDTGKPVDLGYLYF